MTTMMARYMQRIPIELIREHIAPFTYNPQPKQLLQDIRSFHTDIAILRNYYIIFENHFILLYDLIQLCNGGEEAPIYTLSDRYEAIVRRHSQIKNKHSNWLIEYFMCYFHTICNKRNIIFLFGLLTQAERTEFINTYIISQE